MTKKPIDHFSLSDWRKAITEHKTPLFTLTQSEVEALVSRLEKARELLRGSDEVDPHVWWLAVEEWLASLERAK